MFFICHNLFREKYTFMIWYPLADLLTNFNLMQHVAFQIRDRGNILYLIIFHASNNIVSNHSIGPLFSDHLIFLTLIIWPYTTRTTRNLLDCNIRSLISDIIYLHNNSTSDLHTSLTSVLNKHDHKITKMCYEYILYAYYAYNS